MNNNKTYSIGETSEMTGISKRQLRDWEGKYIPEPTRISVGDRLYRRYTPADIRLLKKIQENLARGFTLSAAAKNAEASEKNGKEAGHEEY